MIMATILQAAGAATITLGMALIYVPAGVITGGILAILFGIALERGNAE